MKALTVGMVICGMWFAANAETLEQERQRNMAIVNASSVSGSMPRAVCIGGCDSLFRMDAPRIGMDIYNYHSWGTPYEKRRTTTSNGETEFWYYGPGKSLYYVNGKLASISSPVQ